MACQLFDDEPLPEIMLDDNQLEPYEWALMKFETK